jgi:predicted TIM-barrel fold metal-dependent hydrolase
MSYYLGMKILAGSLLLAAACVHMQPPDCNFTPAAEHHAHIISAEAAKLPNVEPLPAVDAPPDVARLLSERARLWNDKKAIGDLFTEDSVVYTADDHTWIRGRAAVADYLGGRFARPYAVTPAVVHVNGADGYLVGYFTRDGKPFGEVQMSLRKDAGGIWRIAAETPSFPGPAVLHEYTAAQLIAKLDAAGIRRAAILSAAYWFGSPMWKTGDELAKVRAENDWNADQAARYPDRLIAFCSMNPLKDYALEELERCAKSGHFRGVKLHFGNSKIDVKNPQHVETMRQFFRAANRLKLAIIAHLWTTDRTYGREHAEIFLNRILPEAPDVVVQIAHFAGGGPGYTDEALGVYADAIQKGDPRTKNLYFDVATVADDQREETLKRFAARIRQVGVKRVLYGSDLGPPYARQEWMTFRTTVPLTDEEFRAIAANVAPYFSAGSAARP